MTQEATGRLHKILDATTKGNFTRREFVVDMTDNPQYPQHVLFQVSGSRLSLLDGVKVGDQVSIAYNLRGREWQSPTGDVKYFNSLDVWKLSPSTKATVGKSAPVRAPSNEDDLPF